MHPVAERIVNNGGEHVGEYLQNHPTVLVARALAERGFPLEVTTSSRHFSRKDILVSPDAMPTFSSVMGSPKIEVVLQIYQSRTLPDLSQFDADTQRQLRAYHQQCIHDWAEKTSRIAAAKGMHRVAQNYTIVSEIASRRKTRVLNGLSELDVPAFVGEMVGQELEGMHETTIAVQVS